MKSLLTLHLSTLRSVAQHCSISIDRDVSYLAARWEDEGDSFLTITLPRFAKALERGLEAGRWPDHEPLGFKRSGGLPAFMRGFLIRIFQSDGTLRDDPDVDCIWAVRQAAYLSHKVDRDCTPERVTAAFDQFISTEEELRGLPGRISTDRVTTFKKVALRLFGDLFAHCDRTIAEFGLIPKHGPGSVAEGLSQAGKRRYGYWTERLEGVFPFWRYSRNSGYAQHPMLFPCDGELPVKVIAVPKTQATPRIIAIEPSTVQYAQQGLKREMYEFVARGPLNRVLGFSDQTRNREMARLSSLDHSLATLDLSEASDRVHWWVVYRMVQDFPHLWEFLWATRSHRASVPGYGIVPLQKFASMGSAVTFPLEAIVFTTLAVCGMISSGAVKYADVRLLDGLLSVYGDDIIVPVTSVADVIDWLEHFGAKVNQHKSFWRGSFRESCGAEYYRGTDVSVVRLRADPPGSRQDAARLAKLVDFRNRAYRSGLWSLVKDVDEELESLIVLPHSSLTQDAMQAERFPAFIALDSFLGPQPLKLRRNLDLQRWEHQVPVLQPLGISYRVDGEPGLLEWFHSVLRRGDFVSRYDSKERASSFSIKRRWTAFE